MLRNPVAEDYKGGTGVCQAIFRKLPEFFRL